MYLGIDFGTSTNYMVKIDIKENKIIQIDNIGEFGEGEVLSNAIYYGKNEALIGKSALKRSESDPKNLVRYIKLKLGKENYKIFIPRKNKEVLAVEIASDIFKAIKDRVESLAGGEKVDGVVITVPFDYRHRERKAIKEAAEVAGLKVIGLIEEPLAASISGGIDEKEERVELVFDLGGGTLDITISKVIREAGKVVIETLNTEGSKEIGGRHIDKIILEYLNEKEDIEGIGYIEKNRLLEEIRKEKENLVEDEEGEIFFKFKNGECIEEEFTEEILEEILEKSGLLEEIRCLLDTAIEDINIKKEEIKRVLFVGGATRLNIIKSLVEKFIGSHAKYVHYREQKLVGEGAGYYLMDLISEKSKYKIIPKLNHSIGIDKQGRIERVLEKNFEYNKNSEIKEYKISEEKKRITFDIYQGESIMTKDCVKIGRVEVDGTKINEKIGISLMADKNGIIKYKIYDLGRNKIIIKERELS